MRFDSVMYRPVPSLRDRTATLIAVVLVHVALAFALLNLSGAARLAERDVLTQLIEISAKPPPPPIVEIQPETARPKKQEGAASARNIESQATPVVAPEPVIEVPTLQPIVASPTPAQGAQATQGASDVVGPGTGAGGSGTGTGSGGSGAGDGGGGNGVGSRPTLATRALTRFDYPPEIAARWPRRGAVFAAVRVAADGRPLECRVDRSIGDRAIDEWTCSLILNQVRFRPATDANGRVVAGWYGYIQEDRGGR